MNDRFKFRCWIEGEFPKLVPNYDGEHTEYVYCDEAYGYYIYSDTVSDGQIVTDTDDIEKACGLNEEDFESYLDYLDDRGNLNPYGYVFFGGILEKCTGGEDRNGKLVYEGDILEDGGGYRFVVKWSDRQCGFYGYTTTGMIWISLNTVLLENFVIIGNIHENPELLNV